MQNKYQIMPIIISSYHINYEDPTYDLSDLISWRGDKLPLRPSQANSVLTIGKVVKETWSKNNLGVVIILDKISDLFNYLVGSVRKPFHTPKARYLIILLHIMKENDKWMISEIFDKMFNDYGIMHIMFCSCNSDHITYYEPFEKSKGSADFGVLKEEHVFNTTICHRSKLNYPESFKQYPINCGYFTRLPTAGPWTSFPDSFFQTKYADVSKFSPAYGGFDGLLYGNLVKILNFSTTQMFIKGKNKYGHKLPNGTFEGSIGELLYGDIDIASNLHFILDYESEQIEFLRPVFFDRFCVIVPKAKRIPQSMAIFKCFTLSTWIAIGILNFSLGLIWYFIKILSPINIRDRQKPSISSALIDMTIIMANGSLPGVPSYNIIERVFFTFVFSMGIILNGIYQGNLREDFISIDYYKDIETLEEVDKSNLLIAISSGSIKNVFGAGDNVLPHLKSLVKKMVYDPASSRKIAAANNSYAFLDRESDFRIEEDKFRNQDGTQRLHLVHECPQKYSLAMVVNKDWIFADRFNRILGLLDDGGFRVLWYSITKFQLNLKTTIRKIKKGTYRSFDSAEVILRSFTIDDMQTAFYILFVGYLASLLAILGEQIAYFISRNCHRFKFINIIKKSAFLPQKIK